MKKLRNISAMVGASILGAVPAMAAITFPQAAEADLTPVETWLGIAVVAYLALFGYRKFVKTAGRS